jgi:archaeoflavoprotein AfpA
MRCVWALTGAGDLLTETVTVMEELAAAGRMRITAVLSRAAVRVIAWYSLRERLEALAVKVLEEKDANTPFIVGPLQTGACDFLLAAPLTANTASKIAFGIADSLVSNAVAQANKAMLPVYLLPVDQHPGEITTLLPDGSPLRLRIRSVDAENVERLRRMDGIQVLERPGDIRAIAAGRGAGL